MLRRTAGLTLAALLVVVGAVWTFQGIGVLEGSPMTDEPLWAFLGPLVAGLGVGLGITVVQKRH